MNRFSRHPWIKRLRLPALALLMLAVLVNPVFAAVGDLHEASHGSAGHSQPVEAHDHDHDTGVETHQDQADTPGEGLDFLHALMHAAHCCGHLTAILSSASISHVPLSTAHVPVPAFAAPHSPPRTDPFRPPIAI